MKKSVIIALAFMTTMSVFAQGVAARFKNPVPPKNMYRQEKPIIRSDIPSLNHGPHYTSPNSGIATAVTISGSVALILRGIQELSTPPPPVIVLPPELSTDTIVVKEMEPVVKHPVPITLVPMEIITYP